MGATLRSLLRNRCKAHWTCTARPDHPSLTLNTCQTQNYANAAKVKRCPGMEWLSAWTGSWNQSMEFKSAVHGSCRRRRTPWRWVSIPGSLKSEVPVTSHAAWCPYFLRQVPIPTIDTQNTPNRVGVRSTCARSRRRVAARQAADSRSTQTGEVGIEHNLQVSS